MGKLFSGVFEASKENKKRLSEALQRRLPAYYRCVCAMEAEGIRSTTSNKIAAKLGNTSAQVRQDMYTCGGSGGYEIAVLKKYLAEKIGIFRKHRMVVVGAGNLGRAIVSFEEFSRDGFFIEAVFDSNLLLEGMQIGGVPIMNAAFLDDYLKRNEIDIVVISVPACAAQEVFEKAVASGVKGVWNFAAIDLRPQGNTEVQNVHLSDSLMTLSLRIEEKRF